MPDLPVSISSSASPLAAVLFDLDGTLLDTALDFAIALNILLKQEGRPQIDASQIRNYVTDGSKGIIIAAFGIDAEHQDFSRLQADLLTEYRLNLTNKTILFKGLESTIKILNDNKIAWGVVTNKPVEYAQPIMDSLLPQSSVLVCPDHVSKAKPDPEGLHLACKKLGVPAENCIYVGDHIRDIDAGNAANMATIGVEWGYIDLETDHPSTWGASHVAAKPEDLAPLITRYL